MRKSLQTNIKSLLITALVAGALWSCQDDKPEIHIPVPQKEFKKLETITPDTLTFIEGDSAVFSLRTIPYNLLSRDGLTIQIADTAGNKYQYAEIKSYKLVANSTTTDSIWNIVMKMKYGMHSGDIISIMVADKDTVMYSDETVLNMIPKQTSSQTGIFIANKDSIAAFLSGGNATIQLRTSPWDMLFDGNTNTISLIDTTGAPIDNKYTIDTVYFQPKDSTWNVIVNILDKNMQSDYLAVTLTRPDTVFTSGPAKLLLVSISMSSVKTGNYLTMKYDSKTNTYSYCLPTTTDFSEQKFLFTHDGDKVTVGDSLLKAGQYNVLNASKPITVSVWKYNAHKDFIVKLTNTGLPVVRINTKEAVTRRDTWVKYNTMRIELPDGTVDYECKDSVELKGRGNGTWTETNKKPYAIKLPVKAKILGMHKQKRWCLLANYKDRTLLRNDAAFWLSRHTELPYTVSGRYVELVWNGKHMGNYYLCEQIRIDNHRVDIADPNLNDPENGGMLILIDDFLDYSSNDRKDKSPSVGFRSTGASNRYKLPYILKDPEEDENGNLLTSSSPTYKYLYKYVTEMEDAIYNASSSNHKWQQYLDMDKAIDYVLIQEITMNHDSYNTWPKAGPHSAYLYKDSCGILCYGPVWDFDYHTFTLYNDFSQTWSGSSWNSNENPRLKQWEILKMDNKNGNKYYFSDLVKRDPQFKARLLERWNMYKNVWKDSLPIYIDQMADSIRVSESYNIKIWAENTSLTNYKQNGDYNLSFQEAVNAMKTAFIKRWEWMDQNLPKLGQ